MMFRRFNCYLTKISKIIKIDKKKEKTGTATLALPMLRVAATWRFNDIIRELCPLILKVLRR